MGYGLDEKGLKMSKSKGNALDPLPIIEKFGADTFRFWSASEVNHGNDFRCSEQKIESTKKFLTKLWNVRQRNVPSVALPSLLGKKEPSIPGWTPVSRHYSLQNSKRMRSFSRELTLPQ